ncbi:hypothetical protein EDB85DRAFT_1927895 [Lactarius pseudohatsudake]|nr:hypothetical protein EDB85DRAFT_1927895 [Lactarius pseudohatsudake]
MLPPPLCSPCYLIFLGVMAHHSNGIRIDEARKSDDNYAGDILLSFLEDRLSYGLTASKAYTGQTVCCENTYRPFRHRMHECRVLDPTMIGSQSRQECASLCGSRHFFHLYISTLLYAHQDPYYALIIS